MRAGPRQPNMTLPYSNVDTARACISYIRTLLLNNPNNRVWHLILLNAALVLYILFSNIADGLLFTLLIISPKYLNSYTFSRGRLLHMNYWSILIYIAFVFPTLIFNPLVLQKFSKAFSICYSPSALCDNKTASSAKARKKTYKVAISKMYLIYDAILCSSKYLSKYGYTWSKKIPNNLGEAPSPCFTPVFALKFNFFCPSIHTTPLLFIYIFRMICIRHGGIYSLCAMSSHKVFLSTLS